MNKRQQKLMYVKELEMIRQKKCTHKVKLKLLEGLVQKLRLVDNNPQLLTYKADTYKPTNPSIDTHKSLFSKKNFSSEYQSTSYSFCSDQESFLQPLQHEYEQKILQKRVIKFEINEEIEALEDDLFELQKVIETKRTLNDDLSKCIQKKMKEIGEKTSDKKFKQELFSFTTSFSSFRNKKKEQQSSFDMNVTVSGAYGFGFNNYKTKDYSGSISAVRQCGSGNISDDLTDSPQRKKAKSHYLGKGFTGIFKGILK